MNASLHAWSSSVMSNGQQIAQPWKVLHLSWLPGGLVAMPCNTVLIKLDGLPGARQCCYMYLVKSYSVLLNSAVVYKQSASFIMDVFFCFIECKVKKIWTSFHLEPIQVFLIIQIATSKFSSGLFFLSLKNKICHAIINLCAALIWYSHWIFFLTHMFVHCIVVQLFNRGLKEARIKTDFKMPIHMVCLRYT